MVIALDTDMVVLLFIISSVIAMATPPSFHTTHQYGPLSLANTFSNMRIPFPFCHTLVPDKGTRLPVIIHMMCMLVLWNGMWTVHVIFNVAPSGII